MNDQVAWHDNTMFAATKESHESLRPDVEPGCSRYCAPTKLPAGRSRSADHSTATGLTVVLTGPTMEFNGATGKAKEMGRMATG
eukprot:gene23467-17291_t